MTAFNRTGRGPHTYNIDGLLSVVSDVALPELQVFRTGEVGSPDLVIELGLVGGLGPRLRSDFRRLDGHLVYREHLGALASNFKIDLGTPMAVTVSPMFAISPHVLYTNIVEPLLRFLFVKRDRMLLHAACIELDGLGILLSAKTDTGKTSTILRLLRARAGAFLSDDMTIIDAGGTAYRYPKPLTISAHTLSAVPQNRLRRRQRSALSVQSRLHSRGGRSVGKRLGQSNLPIMSMNSVVQAIIPPPKYMITDLVPCRMVRQIRMDRFYIIERGQPRLVGRLDADSAIQELIENTEDAYGFPPYAFMAPQLVIGGDDYPALLKKERAILTSALQNVELFRLRVDDFSWPALIGEQLDAGVEPPARAAVVER
jgi:dolichol-phosphate mannosyltransferase